MQKSFIHWWIIMMKSERSQSDVSTRLCTSGLRPNDVTSEKIITVPRSRAELWKCAVLRTLSVQQTGVFASWPGAVHLKEPWRDRGEVTGGGPRILGLYWTRTAMGAVLGAFSFGGWVSYDAIKKLRSLKNIWEIIQWSYEGHSATGGELNAELHSSLRSFYSLPSFLQKRK